MKPNRDDFGRLVTEADCLAEVMRLTCGGRACPACETTDGFAEVPVHRSFACRTCGFKLYPCLGTPFAKPRPALTDWFFAVHLDQAPHPLTVRRLREAIGLGPKAAEQMLSEVRALRQKPILSDSAATWSDAIMAFLRKKGVTADPIKAADPAAHTSLGPDEDRESLWQSLRAIISANRLAAHPLAGMATIILLALAGAGLGWLAVPPPPEADTELEQASAILTLAYDKPVILVTPEVAKQLYDVTDVDTVPESPLAPSIRLAPASDGDKLPTNLSEAQPIQQPSVKLSAGLGRSLLQGDVSGAKAKAEARPDLAAYNALARELETSGPRNPDELLVFGPMRIRRYLVDKIVRAGRVTETDPVLLMAIADKESSFQTEVQAQTSSASGLFQFIEKTWLGVVREFGAAYGLMKEAAAIASGDLPAGDKTRVLDLRRDAYLSAVMAAEMLKRDSLRIAKRIGRPLTGGEVYLVHFLGPDGAERMLDYVTHKPDTVAADLLPKPAAANKPIFYASDQSGAAKSLSVAEVHSKFETMMSLRLDRYRSVKAPRDTATRAR